MEALNKNQEKLYNDKIPISNIWLLMLYASNYYREYGRKLSSIEEAPDDIPDLLAKMLCNRVAKKMQKNLTRGYEVQSKYLSRLRGRINILETETKQLLSKGKVSCSFHELTTNTVRNRFIKSALERFSQIAKSLKVESECVKYSTLLFRLGVTGQAPNLSMISREVFSRHDAEDRELVLLSKLAFEMSLPSEVEGDYYLQSPNRDDAFLRTLFEKAVAGFYQHNLFDSDKYVWPGRRLNWQMSDKSSGIDDIFPSMQTDIEIEDDEKLIVIDTKFNSLLVKGRYRESTIRSGYIYQIYAYLRSQEKPNDEKTMKSTGILLHPSIGENINENVKIQGHQISFVTVDLTGTASEITKRLLEVIGCPKNINED